ncbi:MAG: hypothetical protein ACNYWU_04835 [Desulfobacterales bacterium]
MWTIKFDDQKEPSLEDIPEEEVKLVASQARRIFDHLSEAQEFIMKNRDGLLEEVDKIISGKTNI